MLSPVNRTVEWAADFRSISIHRDYTMRVLYSKVLGSKASDHGVFFPVASAIGLAWAYRSTTRAEYAELLLDVGFVLLAVANLSRKSNAPQSALSLA